jgi:histidinol phosphatase-like enzyme
LEYQRSSWEKAQVVKQNGVIRGALKKQRFFISSNMINKKWRKILSKVSGLAWAHLIPAHNNRFLMEVTFH